MNLSRILKALLPSFVPLLVYVLAEAFFGQAIGLYVGLATGGLEFLILLVKDRRPDPFVAVDTALLGLAGAISLLSGNAIFFKLKPAVIELVFGASFGLFLVLPPRYLQAWLARQLKGIDLPDTALPAMRRNLGLMLGILAFHALLTVWAALALSTEAWGFVSGVLLYILFGILLGTEYLVARLRTRKARALAGAARGEDLLPVVDEEGKIIGQAPARLCRADPGLLRPVIRLILVDAEGRLWLRRSPATAEAEASAWDAALSVDVRLGEDLDAALARSLRESLGLTSLVLEASGSKAQAMLRYRRDGALDEAGQPASTPTGSELVFLFVLSTSALPRPDAAGGSEGRIFPPLDFGLEVEASRVSPRFLKEYEMLVRATRESQDKSTI